MFSLHFKQYVSMFYNDQELVLLCICFKISDFLLQHIAHFDLSANTLFFIITFFEALLPVCILHFKQ